MRRLKRPVITSDRVSQIHLSRPNTALGNPAGQRPDLRVGQRDRPPVASQNQDHPPGPRESKGCRVALPGTSVSCPAHPSLTGLPESFNPSSPASCVSSPWQLKQWATKIGCTSAESTASWASARQAATVNTTDGNIAQSVRSMACFATSRILTMGRRVDTGRPSNLMLVRRKTLSSVAHGGPFTPHTME